GHSTIWCRIRRKSPMSSGYDPTTKTLSEIPAETATEIGLLFAAQRNQFDQDVSERCTDFFALEGLRVNWTGRKSGVLSRIGDNWLKPAKKELKPLVGQAVNELKAHIEQSLEERRSLLEKDFTTRGALLERVDLSLPGVIRPIGSRHLLRQVMEEIEDIFFSIG